MGEREGQRRGRSKHAAEKQGSGIFKKFVLILILLVLIAGGGFFAWYNMSLSGTGTSSEEVSFDIEMGSGTEKIASVLKEKGLIKDEFAFKLYVKLNNVSNFKAGKYTIKKSMGVPEIVESLQNGILFKDSYNVTFVEGKTFWYISKTIAENTNNTEQDVYDLVKDETYLNKIISKYWFITDDIKNKNIYYPLEGYLFPETYSFEEKDITVEEIFDIMLDQMAKVLNKHKTDIQSSGHSVHDILSMASIIENEAMHDKDRKDVASVLYNRLSAKMSLGCDVTTYYGCKIELGSRDLYKNEINTYNPYNTRGPNMEGKLPVRAYFVS